MPRDLVKFTPEETKQGVIVYKSGIQTMEAAEAVIAGLRPGDMMDFVNLPGGKRVLIISDTQIPPASELMEEAEFVPLDEVPIEVASWSLPLCLPAIVSRSLDDKDAAWFVLEEIAGRYLELGAWSDQTKPWKDGLVAATVRSNWDEWKKIGAVSDESHWGWIKSRYFVSNGGESWKQVKGRFEGWMRAADVFLRNVHGREWITSMTLNQILEVHISKAIRCCGAIEKGLFSYSETLRKALFNPNIKNNEINHLIAIARAHQDEVPIRQVDEDGVIEYVVPVTGEVLDEVDMEMLDQYLPELDGGEIGVSSTPQEGVFWTYNFTTQSFVYYEDGEQTIGLSVQTDDKTVRAFVDRIIASCGVAAEYE